MKKLALYSILISAIRDCQAKHRLKFSLSMRKPYLPLARFLVELGIINGFMVDDHRLHIFVRYYSNGAPVISMLKKPALSSRRIYIRAENRYPVNRPFKLIILTTTKGLMLQTTARFLGIGGRSLFEIN